MTHISAALNGVVDIAEDGAVRLWKGTTSSEACLVIPEAKYAAWKTMFPAGLSKARESKYRTSRRIWFMMTDIPDGTPGDNCSITNNEGASVFWGGYLQQIDVGDWLGPSPKTTPEINYADIMRFMGLPTPAEEERRKQYEAACEALLCGADHPDDVKTRGKYALHESEAEFVIAGKTIAEIEAESAAANTESAGIWDGPDTLDKLVKLVQERHIGDDQTIKIFLLIHGQRHILNLAEHSFLSIYGKSGSGKTDLVKSVIEILPEGSYLFGTGSDKYLTRKGPEVDRTTIIVDDQTLKGEFLSILKTSCSGGNARQTYGTLTGINNDMTAEYLLPKDLNLVFLKVDTNWGPDTEQIMNRMIVTNVESSPDHNELSQTRIGDRLTVEYYLNHTSKLETRVYELWKGLPEGVIFDVSPVKNHIVKIGDIDNRLMNRLYNLIASAAFYRQWPGDMGLWDAKGKHWNPETGEWEDGGKWIENVPVEKPNPQAQKAAEQGEAGEKKSKKGDGGEPQTPAKLPRVITTHIRAPVLYADKESTIESMDILNDLLASPLTYLMGDAQETLPAEKGPLVEKGYVKYPAPSKPKRRKRGPNTGSNFFKFDSSERQRVHDALIDKCKTAVEWDSIAKMADVLELNRMMISRAINGRDPNGKIKAEPTAGVMPFIPGLTYKHENMTTYTGESTITKRITKIIWNPDDYRKAIKARGEGPRFEWRD